MDARPVPFSEALAEELLAAYGSPLYVYDADRLRADSARITRAVTYPRTRFHYACVTNGNLALMRVFRAHGWGLHANTPGDVYLGLHAGFAPADIVHSGGNLNRDEMGQMLARGVGTLNLDSLAQLDLLCDVWEQRAEDTAPPRVGFRLNLPDITGPSRIGIPPADFPAAERRAARAGLKVSGLHFYRGTGTNATPAFTRAIAAVLEAGRALGDWEFLDFGGGFGYPYRAGQSGFDWEEFGAALTRHLAGLDRPVDLLIEPGRAAVAGCGTLLARVVSVKWQGEKQIVGVDASTANIAVLSVHGGYREIRAFRPEDECFITDVCGNTTFSRDYLGRGCPLPALRPGEALAILDAGAYGYAMASHFLHRPRPAEVLIEGGAHRLVRRREGYETLIEQQVFQSIGGTTDDTDD